MACTDIEIAFFKSAVSRTSKVSSTDDILKWLQDRNAEVHTSVRQIPLDSLRNWKRTPETGNLVHASGRFFSVEGIRIQTDWGKVASWDQPIIDQPEIGFLGIITKAIDGVLHLLMQAKIEPGNINKVQLSPTLQATKSNYTRVHKGAKPLFLEYFTGEKPARVLLDQLQSEQGARFLRKRNRNIIIQVGDAELTEVPSDFLWVTLGQLKELVQFDNVVNMDTRSVISGIPFGSYGSGALQYFSALSSASQTNIHLMNSALNSDDHLHDYPRIISWLTGLKSRFELSVERIPLISARGWVNGESSIHHETGKYFSVIGVNVEIGNREVVSWDQPMVKPAQDGIIAFIAKSINGVYHFLVQAKLEAGNFDIVELAPTVQCLTGNYRTGKNEYTVPFLADVLAATPDRVWYSAHQSEEGGRFFEEQNRNMIVEVGDDFPIEVPETYCWMTLHQLHTFIMFNNFLNIAARSLISAIRF